MCASWILSVASTGTIRLSPLTRARRPPSRPVSAIVSASRALAASTARTTFEEFPLVLIATSTSPFAYHRLGLPSKGGLELVVVAPAGQCGSVQEVVRGKTWTVPLVACDEFFNQMHRVSGGPSVAARIQAVASAERVRDAQGDAENVVRMVPECPLYARRLGEGVTDQT